MSPHASPLPPPPKGKATAGHPPLLSFSARDEGAGGEDGLVVPLDLVDGSYYQSIYTVPILVGEKQQNFSLQVDTGSSDLWIASTSCSTSYCRSTGGHLYDPSSSTPTGKSFTITYVEGEVDGPIVWDTVQLGSYNITSQALAAASNVVSEPLSANFNGVLGLALPLNSVIVSELHTTTGNNPDGATFASNLFGMTPAATGPPARFLSLSLARPGSTTVPSLLGIGRHPSAVAPDPTKINYSPLVADNSGSLFWKTTVRAVTVYVDGQSKSVSLGASATAIVDSGMPVILTSIAIANGVYGALGITPSSDGYYYIPCTTPINMTISLDDRPEIALHPLDLTTVAPSASSTAQCIGLIQTYPDSSLLAQLADVILGVPFMRNTYTVMAYDPPNAAGAFPDAASLSPDAGIRPRLGLLGLTDPTTALDEFHTVRVLNQPLSTAQGAGGGGGRGGGGGGQLSGGAGGGAGGKRLSVGVEVLIGLVGFFALCFALFSARWVFVRRRYAKGGGGGGSAGSSVPGSIMDVGGSGGDRKDEDVGMGAEALAMRDVAYRLARRSSRSDPYGPSGETLRALRSSEYARKSVYTDDSARTRVGSSHYGDGDGDFDKLLAGGEGGADGEAGYYRKSKLPSGLREFDLADRDKDYENARSPPPDVDAWDPESALIPDAHALSPDSNSQRRHSVISTRPRMPSDAYVYARHAHLRTPSGEPGVAVPLLAHTRDGSREMGLGLGATRRSDDGGAADLGMGEAGVGGVFPGELGHGGQRESMAGVGAVGSLGGGAGVRGSLGLFRASRSEVSPAFGERAGGLMGEGRFGPS